MKAIYNKIENAKALYNEYKKLNAEQEVKYEAMWVDNKGTYNALKHMEWCDAHDAMEKAEKNARRAIKKLCKDFGFECKKSLKYDSEMEDVLEAIESQYNKAVRAFYDFGWYSAELAENKETSAKEF